AVRASTTPNKTVNFYNYTQPTKKIILQEQTTMGITNFCVLGERVSGTCMLRSLLAQNILGFKAVEFNHKHFFQDIDEIRRADTTRTLFVHITREPIAWVKSMCKTCYHTHQSLKKKDVSTFMRKEWHCVEDESSVVYQESPLYGKEMLHERNPSTGQRFKNVLSKRSWKIARTMALRKTTENFVHVSLGDLQLDSEPFLAKICSAYNLRRSGNLIPVTTVRGKGKVLYKPTVYPELSQDDEEYVLQELDLEAEAMVGYC
ncbi:unnamed protein product, partial [Ectocarpus sp. 6 AP-2014]